MKPLLRNYRRHFVLASAIGSSAVLLACGSALDQRLTSQCNAGVLESCKKLLVGPASRRDEPAESTFDSSLITTAEGKAQLAKAQKEVEAERLARAAKIAKQKEEAAAAKAEREARSAQLQAELKAAERARDRALGYEITLANFNRLRPGMNYGQVKDILGLAGTISAENNIAGYSAVLYSWMAPGNTGANMNVMFQNGRLIQKAQFGLK